MTAFILLLRGVNVGGAGKLPMAGLRSLLEDLGCAAVQTYVQSGNAVFRSGMARAALAAEIGAAIAAAHGFRPAVFLLTVAEMRAALDGNPWPEAEADAKPMHLFFHDGSAEADAAALDALVAEGEAWTVTPEVLYLRAENGIGRSKLAGKLDRHFKAAKTGRNLNTCRRLLALAEML